VFQWKRRGADIKMLKKMYCEYCGSRFVKKEIPDMTVYLCLLCLWNGNEERLLKLEQA
jgi:DNA-directed RNA polymerase subunit RPC12/RpoP